jgi:hypothetical protein
MRHTGLRSLFVRALVGGSGSGGGAFGWNEPNEPLPPYFPSGVPH